MSRSSVDMHNIRAYYDNYCDISSRVAIKGRQFENKVGKQMENSLPSLATITVLKVEGKVR